MLALAALADPTRLHIVEMLGRHGQRTAGEISRQFSITPSAVSQHLNVLKKARLVLLEVRGPQRLYRLNPAALQQIEQWAARLGQACEATGHSPPPEHMYY